LKAAPGQQVDKLFYLTAKTPGRRLALDALERIRAHTGGAPLRVTELVAREKACEHPDKACHGESCPLAAGFHDRLPQARRSAADARWLDRLALREIALSHRICPYYLGSRAGSDDLHPQRRACAAAPGALGSRPFRNAFFGDAVALGALRRHARPARIDRVRRRSVAVSLRAAGRPGGTKRFDPLP